MSVLRSIGAILAGIVVVVALQTGIDLALESSHIFPPPAEQAKRPDILAIALGYRLVTTVLGGWITARLAPSKPMLHALILGAIGTAVALLGCIVQWKIGQQWYPIALVVTAIPCTWLGGWLVERSARAGGTAAA